MTKIDRSASLAETIRELYGIVRRLEDDYSDYNRHFTLDGHLVGSIGEVYAAERYGIELLTSSSPTHDGVAPDGRLVQIKATQRKSVALNDSPNYLIVFKIDEDGRFEEVYNGPGEPVWALLKDRKMPKTGQYQISLSKLAELDAAVSQKDRIPALN